MTKFLKTFSKFVDCVGEYVCCLRKINKEITDKTLVIEIFWSEEDNGYIARPTNNYTRFSGFGSTRMKAVKELEIAMGGL